jgi:hypothetical protein
LLIVNRHLNHFLPYYKKYGNDLEAQISHHQEAAALNILPVNFLDSDLELLLATYPTKEVHLL